MEFQLCEFRHSLDFDLQIWNGFQCLCHGDLVIVYFIDVRCLVVWIPLLLESIIHHFEGILGLHPELVHLSSPLHCHFNLNITSTTFLKT